MEPFRQASGLYKRKARRVVELLVSSYSSMSQRLYKLVSGNSTFPANFARLMITKWRQETKLFPFKKKQLQILKMMIKVSINSNQRFPRCRSPFGGCGARFEAS